MPKLPSRTNDTSQIYSDLKNFFGWLEGSPDERLKRADDQKLGELRDWLSGKNGWIQIVEDGIKVVLGKAVEEAEKALPPEDNMKPSVEAPDFERYLLRLKGLSELLECAAVSRSRGGVLPKAPPGRWVNESEAEWPSLACLYLVEDPTHTMEFPAAVVSKLSPDSAMIMRIKIEVYEPKGYTGPNSACLHPRAWLRWDLGDKFHRSLDLAWRAVHEESKKRTGKVLMVDISPWSVTGEEKPAKLNDWEKWKEWEIENLSGASAGGAFQRGFFRALKGRPSEPTLLVMCEIAPPPTGDGTASWAIKGTEGVGRKVEALFHHNQLCQKNPKLPRAPIRTVLLMKDDKAAAATALGLEHGDEVELREIGTATELENSPNSVSKELAELLTKASAECEKLPPRGGASGTLMSTLFVEPYLLPYVKDSVSAFSPGAKWGSFPEIQGEGLSIQTISSILQSGGRVCVVSVPGMGKTSLSRIVASRLAVEVAQSLRSGHSEANEVKFPLLVSAQKLSSVPGGLDAAGIVSRLLKDLELGGTLRPEEQLALEAAATDGRMILLVDSLDEVEGPGPEQQLLARLMPFIEVKTDKGVVKAFGGIMMTCRIDHWASRRRQLVQWFPVVLELQPLGEGQQKLFAENYFGSVQRAHEFLQKTRGMGSLLSLPLFLTFAALLDEHGKFMEREDPHRFMEHMLEASLGGWLHGREPEEWATPPRNVEVLRFLSLMVWTMFQKRPVNRFHSISQWKAAWDRCQEVMPFSLTGGPRPGWLELLEYLTSIGIVVKSDDGKVPVFDVAYAFAHRQEMEFLAATGFMVAESLEPPSGIRNHPALKPWDAIKKFPMHRWPSSELSEFFMFLVAILEEPEKLFRFIRDRKRKQAEKRARQQGGGEHWDDLFGELFGLKCRLIGTLRAADSMAADLAKEWLDVWRSPADSRVRINHFFHGYSLAQHPKAKGILTRELHGELGEQHAFLWEEKPEVWKALGKLDLKVAGKTVQHVMSRMLDGANILTGMEATSMERVSAAEILGELWEVEAFDSLCMGLDDDEPEVACRCAVGIGKRGKVPEGHEEKLLGQLRDCLDPKFKKDLELQTACAHTLGRLRLKGAAAVLGNAWRNPDLAEAVRITAVESLAWPSAEYRKGRNGRNGDPESEVRAELLEEIKKIRAEAGTSWAGNQCVREAALWVVAWLDDEAPPRPDPNPSPTGRKLEKMEIWQCWFEHLDRNVDGYTQLELLGPPFQVHLAGMKVVEILHFEDPSRDEIGWEKELAELRRRTRRLLDEELGDQKRTGWLDLLSYVHFHLEHEHTSRQPITEFLADRQMS